MTDGIEQSDDKSLEQDLEFAMNPEPRCPCVVLVDTSGSMQGDPLHFAKAAVFELKSQLGEDDRFGLVTYATGGEVAIEVRDHGVGIGSADRERVFEAFYSTRRGGTGLGLAVVRRIAQAHAGDIRVNSAPGVGTTMKLLLPRANAAAASL